jgi:hypothetical protein
MSLEFVVNILSSGEADGENKWVRDFYKFALSGGMVVSECLFMSPAEVVSTGVVQCINLKQRFKNVEKQLANAKRCEQEMIKSRQLDIELRASQSQSVIVCHMCGGRNSCCCKITIFFMGI